MHKEERSHFLPRRTIDLLTLVLALTACTGCGNGKYAANGEVTFNGQPVEDGTISLEPVDGNGPSTGGKIVAGKYDLSGPAATSPGKKRVRIAAVRKTGRKTVDSFSPSVKLDETEPYIPGIYNTRSTLSCDVVADRPNRLDFHLKSP
jgi:hypothetical protein